MPQFCIVVGCGSRSGRDKVSFYSVPAALNFKHKVHLNKLSQLRREKWLAVIRRDDLTELKIKNERVCGKHFIKGDEMCKDCYDLYRTPAKLEDIDHPDWIPTQHMGYSGPTKKAGKKLIKSKSKINSCAKRLSASRYQSCEAKENKAQLNLVADFTKAAFEADTDETAEGSSSFNTNNVIIVSEDIPDWRVKQEPAEIQLDESPLYKETNEFPQLMNAGVLKCRTCLNIIDSSSSYSISTVCDEADSAKSIKDMITFCIPQMAETISDNDLICSKCLEGIKFCEKFITNCLEVEAKLQCIYDIRDLRNKYYGIKPASSKTSHTFDHSDHSYVIRYEHQVAANTSPALSDDPAIFTSPDTKDLSEEGERLTTMSSIGVVCSTCDKEFQSSVQLDLHLKEVHSEKPSANTLTPKRKSKYKCNLCEKSFTTKYVYKIHLECKHRDMRMRRKTYFCKECMVECETLSDLLDHRLVHGFKCNICSKRCSSKTGLIKHKQTHPDAYFCETCGKGLKSKGDLRSHAYRHKEQSTYVCDKCGCTCKSKETLMYHMKTHKTDNHYMCEKCSKLFLKRSTLLMHQKVVHEKIRNYHCMECGKTFGMKGSLDNHYEIKHSIMKPYQCEVCGLRFGRKDYLRSHKTRFHNTDLSMKQGKESISSFVNELSTSVEHNIPRNTKTDKFKCTFCNLIFTSVKNKYRHEKNHEDASYKHRCQICCKDLKTKEDLNEHLLMHTNSQMYEHQACTDIVSSHNFVVHETEKQAENEEQ